MTGPHSELGVTETFRIQVYEDVESVFPHINRLKPLHRRLLCARLTPIETYQTTNIVQEDLLTDFVDQLDPNTTATGYQVDRVAFGDDSTSPATTDGVLGNEFFRTTIGTYSNRATELETTTTIGGSEQNGQTFAEVGLFDDGGTMLNRALIGPRTKNSGETYTIDVNINFTPL
jgi:hypothetical protein